MNNKTILLTVDVEDWFQVENFKRHIDFSDWDSFEPRYEHSTQKLLALFADFNVQATFFVLGWNAKKSPQLVRDIVAAGHELASHGFNHTLNTQLTDAALHEDLKSSKHLLEDIAGVPVYGYRAPSFSITPQTIESLKMLGYRYDASLNGSALNSRHGSISLSNYQEKGITFTDEEGFTEIPTTNLGWRSKEIPWSGGGYFRLIPSALYRSGVKKILNERNSFVFYTHPWEYDPQQPKVGHASFSEKFRHYIGLNNTERKLRELISNMQDIQFHSCLTHLNNSVWV